MINGVWCLLFRLLIVLSMLMTLFCNSMLANSAFSGVHYPKCISASDSTGLWSAIEDLLSHQGCESSITIVCNNMNYLLGRSDFEKKGSKGIVC